METPVDPTVDDGTHITKENNRVISSDGNLDLDEVPKQPIDLFW